MKKKIVIFVIIALLIPALILIYAERDMLAENPFERLRAFDGPSQAVTESDNVLLVTDSGKTRVTVLIDYKVSATINGLKESNGFFYVEHMAFADGKVYISDVKYEEGSTRVDVERILQFTVNGRFEKVLFEQTYEDNKPFQYGNILDIRTHNGSLIFLIKNGDALELYRIADDGTPSLLRTVSAADAPYLCNAVYDVFAGRVYAVSKDGMIYAENNSGGLAVMLDFSQTDTIPWEVAIDKDSTLYIADLAAQSIILSDGSVFYKGAESVIYRLAVNGGGIVSFTDGENIFQFTAGGEALFAGDTAEYETTYFLWRLAVWILAAVSAVMLLIIAARLCLWLLKTGSGEQTKYLFIIILSTALTAVIVAVSIFNTSLKAEAQEKEFSITQMGLTVSGSSGMTFGGDFEMLNALGDYGGSAYNSVRSVLDPICEATYEQGGYLYYVLYRVVGNMVYAVIDYENTIGVIHPIAVCPDTWMEVFEGAESHLFETYSDVNGSWAYAVTPLYNPKGTIVGLVEMGYNLDVADLRTERQIQETILATAVLLILFLLLFSEIAAIIEPVTELRRHRSGRVPELIRPLIFLAFFADNFYTAFIPQLSGRLFLSSGFDFSLSMGAALPLSAKLFFIAMAAVAGGVLIGRLGMDITLICGAVTEMAGLAVAAAAVGMNSYMLLLAGLSISGLGLGLVVVSCNTIPTYFKDEKKRNSLFTGVSVGMISGIVVGTSVGAYIAQAVGYGMTFVLSAAVLFPALWLSFKSAPHSSEPSFATATPLDAVESNAGGDKADERQHVVNWLSSQRLKMSVMRFLSNRSAFSFLLFAMLPFMVVMSFREFAFPLYAGERAISEVAIGQTLLFSGAIAIFIAPAMTTALMKHLRAKWVNILAGAICAAGLLLFALNPTLQNSIAAVYILSFTASFAYTAQSVYFASIRAAKAFGSGRTMGVFTLFDNLSQTAGPLLFGAALILGYGTAALILGLAEIALLILFILLGETECKNEGVSG